MINKSLLFLILMVLPGQALVLAKAASARSPGGAGAPGNSRVSTAENTFDLSAFGATGDGVKDDGPALQDALNAIAEAGGGTLFVPAGRYAIITPVQKDFTGVASAVTILGVESFTPVAPPNASASQLTRGLDLVSEFDPQTGDQGIAISISGLQSFLIKDIAFMGKPGVLTDALVTLALTNIAEATVRHCEFYGLSTQVGNAIIQSVRSGLTIEQSAFLGSTANSGLYASIIQNIEWKSITITDTVFVDYGQRPELYGKMGLSAPFSWVNIGNAAALTNDSPRREVVIRKVFLDEGGYVGLSSLPYRYQPPSAPIDLVYITGLYMNVSNLGTTGHYFYGLQHVLVENSHYGWSHNTDSAISLFGTGNAILDGVVTEASATRIRADATTGKLTVINSVYEDLASQASTTKVITTATPEDDPVQYVRQQFVGMLGREPDAAAHFYWADRLLQCEEDTQCAADERAALAAYLETEPPANFSVTGQVSDENGASLSGVAVTLNGSQSVTTWTDALGQYQFSNLPTSGIYSITPSKTHYTFNEPSQTFTTPNGEQTADFAATLNRHTITGRATRPDGGPLEGVSVTLSGTQTATVITDANGAYALSDLPAGGNYTLKPSETSYSWGPQSLSFNDLSSNQTANFSGTFVTYTVSGRVTENEKGLGDVSVMLSGSQTAIVTTDANGSYLFILPSEGSYTVTPSKKHYTFGPASLNFNNLNANQTADLAATLNRHSISGRVVNTNNYGMSGLSLTLSGSQAATTTTDANGDFLFAQLPAGGTYTVTPSLAHYSFDLKSQTYNDLDADQNNKFVATPNTHTISGQVTKDGAGFPGVTVTLSSSRSSTTAITGGNGAYSFSGVLAGDNYTLVITKANCTFAPPSQTYNDLGSDQTANFSAFLNPELLTVENSERAIALDSMTFATSPFSLVSSFTFGSTSRTRIMVFTMNIDLQSGESTSAVTAQAEDSQHRIFPLTVEYVGRVPDLDGYMQINLMLPDQPTASGDLWISLNFHGMQSNKASITTKPS